MKIPVECSQKVKQHTKRKRKKKKKRYNNTRRKLAVAIKLLK